jgi:hypothetical protein
MSFGCRRRCRWTFVSACWFLAVLLLACKQFHDLDLDLDLDVLLQSSRIASLDHGLPPQPQPQPRPFRKKHTIRITTKYHPRVVTLPPTPTLILHQAHPPYWKDHHPRTQLLESTTTVSPYHPLLDASPSPANNITKGELQDQEQWEDYLANQWTPQYQRECVPMTSWQTMSFPTCNSVHELDLDATNLQWLGAGGWRYTFLHTTTKNATTSSTTDDENVVLKLFRIGKEAMYDFSASAYERHRVEAVVSERLTASPYILNMYGHCGLTTIHERAQTTLTNHLLRIQEQEQEQQVEHSNIGILSLATKIRYSYQLASALADLHGMDYPSGTNATVVHRDVKTDNILIANDGTLKLNDFNDAVLLNWNQTTINNTNATNTNNNTNATKTCKCAFYNKAFPIQWGLGFTPWEMARKGFPPLDESVDVFGLGGVLYHVLVGRAPYSDLRPMKMKPTMRKGILPSLPYDYDPQVNNETSKELQVLVQVIQSCMSLRPQDRPTAKRVMEQLKSIVLVV